jgi:transposase
MEPLMPAVARTGRRRSIDLREVLNAIRYMVRSGIGTKRRNHQ